MKNTLSFLIVLGSILISSASFAEEQLLSNPLSAVLFINEPNLDTTYRPPQGDMDNRNRPPQGNREDDYRPPQGDMDN